MPFYEYECQSCKYYTEVMQKITDAPITKCPSCGKKTLKKLVSAPVFRLKGSGWYETDFKSDKDQKRNLVGADKDEPKAEVKPAPTTDAKPETKPDAKDAKPAKEAKEAKPAESKTASSSARRSGRGPARPAARVKPKKAKSGKRRR